MTDNPFDQFDSPGLAQALPSGASSNPFDQFDGPTTNATEAAPSGMKSGPTQPWWYPIAQGVAPFGIAPRIEAATAAAKESMSGGLSFPEAYAQALDQYQNAGARQEKDNPTLAPLGKAVGSVVPLMMGGEAINAGLESAGPIGRFLAGSADIPFVGRSAAGQFQKLGTMQKVMNAGTSAASAAGMMAREGAQAGAFGAANSDNGNVAQGAAQGALIGGGAGLLGAPLVAGLGKVAAVPGALASSLPHSLQGVAGLLSGQQLLEHAPALWEMATEHPGIAAGLGAGAGLLGTSRYLAQNPALRDALIRMGAAGYGSANGAQR